jgi:hypothetical protein
VETQTEYKTDLEHEPGQWAILELFGHKVVAGYITKDETFGSPMVRIDVPETSRYPGFTRHYNPTAVYGIGYVSEDVARRTAESLKENPITIYVPDISDIDNLRDKIRDLQGRLLNHRALPDGEDDDEDDDDESVYSSLR